MNSSSFPFSCSSLALLFSFLLFFSSLPSIQADCSDYTDCNSCYAYSALCHWCSFDQECHELLSIYGCLIGEDSPSNSPPTDPVTDSSCYRQQPQSASGESASSGEIGAVCGVAIAILVVLLGLFFLSLYLLRRSERRNLPATETSPPKYAPPLPPRPAYSGISKTNPPNASEYELDSISTIRAAPNSLSTTTATNPSQTNLDPTPATVTTDSPYLYTKERNRYRYCRWFIYTLFALLLALLIVGTTLAIVYYPETPQYSLCSEQIEWGTLVSAIESGSLATGLDLQISVYNPNRISVSLSTTSLTFTYGNNQVGIANDYNEFYFPAESITDIILNTYFSTDASTAVAMFADYENNNLLLDVVATVTGTAHILGLSVGFHRTVDIGLINVNTATNQKWCLCQS